MTELKNIDVLSFAKLQALIGALIGLICGVIYSFGGLIIDLLVSLNLLSVADMSTPGLSYGTILAFGALIGMPLIGALGGYLFGLFEVIVYNTYARYFRGIDVDCKANLK